LWRFAIAYLTSLAHGQNPGSVLYDKKIRRHLKDCFMNGRLEAFPTISQKKKASLRCLNSYSFLPSLLFLSAHELQVWVTRNTVISFMVT